MKKKRQPYWKYEERALRKAKSRKWRRKSKRILTAFDNRSRHEHQKSRAEYIGR